MAINHSLSAEERVRALQMTADALDGIVADAALRDGDLDEETKTRLLERRQEAADRIDPAFALDLASRLGEDALRQAVEENTPPSARASIDALISREGGMLPLVQNEIRRMGSASTTRSSDSFGCALGAVAIVGGVLADKILGGVAAVAGIVAMAKWC
ncbi:hypothetical protein [Nitrolancea hollandica]|uniref:Uncharacterized protein n=1 Tax=Nitrolancea hollandica Lb TaxID=1129897 RepID=I4EE86_9BACT|nr:hypothetical protein [Nitrolancea hollandica]CCF82998.1 hypothetical protein NITHO_1750013 [Nitrolancea hollandica Lb]